jgi:acetyltransferase-like isoleucine patch superfamily enzyme
MMEYLLMGQFDEETAGHNEHYYAERLTFLDTRGGFFADPTCQFGFGVRIITATHDISEGNFGHVLSCPVYIEANAWITSFCILYNCRIGHHSVVSIGSVVANMTVPPYTVVAGNPAIAVKRWNGKKWVKVKKV